MKLNKKLHILFSFVALMLLVFAITGCRKTTEVPKTTTISIENPSSLNESEISSIITQAHDIKDFGYYAWDETDQQIIVYTDSSLDLSIRNAEGVNGVVCAANPYAALAGIECLMKGGNSFDAAVAVSYALGVCEPYASGVGGGGIMVAYDADAGEYVCYNFREFTPAGCTASLVNSLGGDTILDEGITSVAVPTLVAGMNKIVEERCRLDRATIMAPAIRYAEDGFIVTKTLANTISDCMAKLAESPSFNNEIKGVFTTRGTKGVQEGQTLVQTNYGKTLRLIAEYGNDGFYKGETAEAIVKAMEDNGGFITLEDLEYASEHYPITEDPVYGTYKGYEIYSSSNPSSGGLILVETLNCLEYYSNNYQDLAELGFNSPEYVNVLATAMQLAYGDKQKYIGDTGINPQTGAPFVNVPTVALTSKAYAARRFQDNYTVGRAYYGKAAGTVGGEEATNYGKYIWDYNGTGAKQMAEFDGDPSEHFSTTSFSVADKDGNIVSVTQTINHFFASTIVPEGTGFFLNNQQSSFTTSNTQSASYIYPYKQAVSHIMPTIVMKDGEPWATLGSPGSMRIPAAVIQVLVNMIDFGMDMQEAINAPRIFCYASLGTDDESTSTEKWIRVEGISDELKASLESMGYYIADYETYKKGINLYFGGVQGIRFYANSDGTVSMHGGADPRRDGKSFAY